MAEVLDLTTERERPQIKIDGVLFDLLIPTDMGLKDILWVEGAGKEVEKLADQLRKKFTDAAGQQLQRTLNKMTDVLCERVPKEVRAKLSDIQKMAIVEVYSKLVQAERAEDTKKGFFDDGVTPGSISSQGSKGSTEEPSPTG